MPCDLFNWVHFQCLDLTVASEWVKTCGEYFGYVKKPFQAVALKNLWKCQQSDWNGAFREWGVIQLYVGVVSAIVDAALRVSSIGDFGDFVADGIELVTRILMAYLLAHLCWFSIVRKGGCLCCVFCCWQCTPVLLIWGALAVGWGILALASSLLKVTACTWCFIGAIMTALYAVTLLYMGICCLQLWRARPASTGRGAEVVKEAVEVKGPEEAEVVEEAVV